MPLLNKKPFVRREPPPNLQDKDKIFYSEITNEVFTEYEDYWARLVLCNAMVWTCELTGRPNLTYAEAIESEGKARKCLSNVPEELRKPLLYVATLTRRGRYADMSDDVFNYVRDRYFVGEEVEAIVRKHWYDCRVVRLVYPTEEEITAYEEKMAESDEEDGDKKSENGIEVLAEKKSPAKKEEDDDIEIIKVVSPKKDEKPKETKKKEEDEDYPPFATFKYEVIEIEAWDHKEPQKHIVTWEQIRRNKGVITREKCKLFLKQVVQLSVQGFWCLKEKVMKKYDLAKTKYSDIFLGKPPKFQETKSKKLPASLVSQNGRKKEENVRIKEGKQKLKEEIKRLKKEEREKNSSGDLKKKMGRQHLSEGEKELRRKQIEEDKEQKRKIREMKEGMKAERREEMKIKFEKEKEERKRERDLKKEQKRLHTDFLKDWRKPRDDLDCEDHKDLPRPTPVQCRIPDSMFSEFIMVLEFINVFTELLELKDVYPQGITFDMLEHALVEKEVAGVLNDVFQLLLQAIFTLQEEEDDEVEADPTAEEGVIETDTGDISIQEAVRVANRAATWSQQYYGVPLQKVPLDAFTLSEVLRLHLLASGATNVANSQWRHLNRGGFKSTDDPGLLFKLEDPEVLKSLSSQTIFDAPMVDKLKILHVLIGQILTYASARDIVDDNMEKLREMKNKLRLDQMAQQKKEREFNTARAKEKRERLQKVMEKRLKDAEKKTAALAMTGESDKPIELDLDEEEEEEEEDKEELAAKEERELKNKESRRQDFLKKERELFHQMLNIAKGGNIAPLGQDRAYRRYWLFNSLSGLFVEDNEVNLGLCRLTPTPYNPDSNPEFSEALTELFRVKAVKHVQALYTDKDEKSNSDKENDSENRKDEKSDSGNSPTKNVVNKTLLQTPNQNKTVNETQGADSEMKMDLDAKEVVVNGDDASGEGASEGNEQDDTEDEMNVISNILNGSTNSEDVPNIYGLCTANEETCPVHSLRKDHHKWFFYHDIEDMHTLISALNNRGYREKELKNSMECNRATIESSMRSCPVFKLDPSQDPELEMTRKSQRNLTTKKDTDVNLNFPPGTAIEEILQLTLRDMVLETEEKIFMGMLGSIRTENRAAWREAIEAGNYLRETEVDFGGRKRIAQMKTDLGLEVDDNAEGEDLPDEATEAGLVKDLAQAILLVGQSVDAKYLTQPLGETEKLRKKRERVEAKFRKKVAEKVSGDEGSDHESDEEEEEGEGKKSNTDIDIMDNALRTPMERWEVSLMASTNLSQLCLHYATLDNSITWSRSALNARCRICRRRSDAEHMLLCDGCDKGHHIYCLKPKLKSIPSGDWFCFKCKPKEKPKSPRKKNRQIYTEESDDEEKDCGSDSEIENENTCFVCAKSGTLICCDTCPLSFHKECAHLRKIPRGHWSCRQCQYPSEKNVSQPEKKKTKEKERNREIQKVKENQKVKEIQKVKDNSNKENKEKKKNGKGNEKRESPKKAPVKEKTTNKSSPPEKRRSDGGTSDQASKKLRLRESEQENTTPKRSRRSLVDEDCELNSPALETVLEELLKHQLSWPFAKPVSKKDAPDYYEIVKKPMDFRTVHGKLFDMRYSKDEEFIADVMLVFQNCQQYNMEETEEYKAGKVMSKYFMKRVRELGLNYQGERKQPGKKKKV